MDNDRFFEPRDQRLLRSVTGDTLGNVVDLQHMGLQIVDHPYQCTETFYHFQPKDESRVEPLYKHVSN